MTSADLENLARAGKLKPEPADQAEFDGLVRSGETRLADAQNAGLSLEGRFDLAYSASHVLALAALRWHGFRPDSRYMVFQALPLTLGLGPEVWRVLDQGHRLRNLSEYEGRLQVDERFLEDFLRAAVRLQAAVLGLGPVPPIQSAT
jgi:hypothetical protein